MEKKKDEEEKEVLSFLKMGWFLADGEGGLFRLNGFTKLFCFGLTFIQHTLEEKKLPGKPVIGKKCFS